MFFKKINLTLFIICFLITTEGISTSYAHEQINDNLNLLSPRMIISSLPLQQIYHELYLSGEIKEQPLKIIRLKNKQIGVIFQLTKQMAEKYFDQFASIYTENHNGSTIKKTDFFSDSIIFEEKQGRLKENGNTA